MDSFTEEGVTSSNTGDDSFTYIHSLKKYLRSNCSESGTVLATGDRRVNKTEKAHALLELIF